jgi:hypothetical protein
MLRDANPDAEAEPIWQALLGCALLALFYGLLLIVI